MVIGTPIYGTGARWQPVNSAINLSNIRIERNARNSWDLYRIIPVPQMQSMSVFPINFYSSGDTEQPKMWIRLRKAEHQRY